VFDNVRASLNTRRVMFKLSGELLSSPDQKAPLQGPGLDLVANHVINARSANVEVGVVLGAGNIHRGARNLGRDFPRHQSDAIGMVSTLVNALALQAELATRGIVAHVLNAFDAPRVAQLHSPSLAQKYLSQGDVVIFAGGTGNPFFTTDTAAALRAIETDCTLLIKGTKVDGVFSADPAKDQSAAFIPSLTYEEILEQKLGVMDLSAIILCMENSLPVVVLNALDEMAIKKFLSGEDIGTLVLPKGK